MKKGIYIGIAVIIILIIGYFAFFKTDDNTQNLIKTNANTTIINEEKNNEVNENNEIVNEIINEENNQTVQNNVGNNTSTEIFNEEPATETQKAINIVKKDWGEDSNVKIAIDGINDNGSYIVTVRNVNTTEALAF